MRAPKSETSVEEEGGLPALADGRSGGEGESLALGGPVLAINQLLM